MSARCILTFLAALLAGCYRYAPVGGPATPNGAYVRFALLQPTSPELRRVLGAETVAIEGQVVSASDVAYTVAVAAALKPPTVSPAMRRTIWAGEQVVIPREAIGGTELRSLDRKRTTRVFALGAVAAVLAVKLIVSTTGSSSGGGDDGGGVTPP
jgi:hypothetical protein